LIVAIAVATGDASSQTPYQGSAKFFTAEEARQFAGFPLHDLGPRFETLPLVKIHRVDASAQPYEPVREDDVTFIYGRCKAQQDTGCLPPLQVQVWNACERNEGSYGISPDERLRVRGVDAAFFDQGMRLELYTGRVTIVLFAPPGSQELLTRAAKQLKPVGQARSDGANLAPRDARVKRKDPAIC
jgi:hypothetical protein